MKLRAAGQHAVDDSEVILFSHGLAVLWFKPAQLSLPFLRGR